MKTWVLIGAGVCLGVAVMAGVAEDLGQLSANPYGPKSTANPYSPAGSPYSGTSVKNPYGEYGSPYSAKSATNPYATDAPKLYDAQGTYRGKLSSNPYDPDSVSNPYGRYGSPYSADSVNNPYGAGSKYRADSPTNLYGTGWKIEADDPAHVKAPRYAPRVPSFSAPNRASNPDNTRRSTNGYLAPSYGKPPTAADPWQVLEDPSKIDVESDPSEE